MEENFEETQKLAKEFWDAIADLIVKYNNKLDTLMPYILCKMASDYAFCFFDEDKANKLIIGGVREGMIEGKKKKERIEKLKGEVNGDQ